MLCMMLTILSGIASPRSRASSEGDDVAAQRFTAGMQAFRDGEYAAALRAFQAACAAGLDSSQLHYNLGVTYYRLQRYAAARREFERLRDEPGVADIAHYNLGLVALKQGREADAVAIFRAVNAATDNVKLKQLTDRQLTRLTGRPRPWQGWVGFLDLTAGYDDNVALSSDIAGITPSQRGAGYLAVLAGGVGRLSGTRTHGWQGVAAAYAVNYRGLSGYNQVYARAGARYRMPLGDSWKARFGGYVSHTTLGGAAFESSLSGRARLTHPWLASQEFSVEVGHEQVRGAGDYDYLGGSEDWLELADRYRIGQWRWSAGYRYETNARDDIVQPGQFISVSPRRQSVFAGAKWSLTRRLTLDAEVSLRQSTYRDTNIYLDGTQQRRDDQQGSLEVGAAYELTDGWKLAGSYRYLRNDSNIKQYRYRSNRIEFTLKHLFL